MKISQMFTNTAVIADRFQAFACLCLDPLAILIFHFNEIKCKAVTFDKEKEE